MRDKLNGAALLALALAVSFAVMNAPSFLGFAIHADTLYPALLVEELRADPAALFRFQLSRVPGFVPDLLLITLVDGLTGSWRWAFWSYAAGAFLLLSLLGGWIARQIFGSSASEAAVWLGLLLAPLILLALWQQAGFSADWPVNLHLLLMMPIWQSGAFIAGLGVLCLSWRVLRLPSPAGLAGLLLLTLLAVASNTIVVAHAVLPGLIALAEVTRRGMVDRRTATWVAGTLLLAVPAGYRLGALSGRAPLPHADPAGLLAQFGAMLADLLREPAQGLMLLACLPIALAFFWPHRAAARLARGGDAAALRFFITAASAACAAAIATTGLLYFGPAAWRYGNPIAWWPAIFLAGLLAARWPRPLAGLAGLTASGIAGASALSGGGLAPALFHWRPPELACLDAADPEVTVRAGLAAYWHARTMAAASGWRRQVESTDFGEGRPFLWIEDSRSLVQARGGPRGTPPAYRFILMTGLDPIAITRIHGPPERVLPCGATSLWIYPEGWDPLDRLIAMADPLIPEALAVGRRVCTGPGGLLDQGRVVTLPPGLWRIGLHHAPGDAGMPQGGVVMRILSEPDGALRGAWPLDPAAQRIEADVGRPDAPSRLRLRLDGVAPPALHGLSISRADGPAGPACQDPLAAAR